MAWEIKDEWIDLAQGHHRVIFHNPDVLVPVEDRRTRSGIKQVPVEHHLTHNFKLPACPHCGNTAMYPASSIDTVDFTKEKTDMQEQLKAHHTKMMQYREKHPHVRLGNGPKS